VRVKLERINCDVGKLRPPDGDRQAWIDRLKAVLGTASTSSSMRPLSAPGGSAPAQQRGVGDRGERRIGLYRGRAAERGNRMRDRSPNGLRACGYNGRSRPAWWGTWRAIATSWRQRQRQVGCHALFAILVETLRRLRSGGSQVIRIEKVEVRDGGQAVIGNVKSQESGYE